MLSEYHFQFLDHLSNRSVPFLIIGGQAQHQHDGSHTRDLDLWVRVTPGSKEEHSALTSATVDWELRYPSHGPPGGHRPPFDLSRRIQIHYPIQDTFFLTATNEIQEIAAQDGVDLLINATNNIDFQIFFARALMKDVKGRILRFLPLDDVNVINS
jgi:hypothetical protein